MGKIRTVWRDEPVMVLAAVVAVALAVVQGVNDGLTVGEILEGVLILVAGWLARREVTPWRNPRDNKGTPLRPDYRV